MKLTETKLKIVISVLIVILVMTIKICLPDIMAKTKKSTPEKAVVVTVSTVVEVNETVKVVEANATVKVVEAGSVEEILNSISTAEGTLLKDALKYGIKSSYDITYAYNMFIEDNISISEKTFGEIDGIQDDMIVSEKVYVKNLKLAIASGDINGTKLLIAKKKLSGFVYSTALGKYQFNRVTLNEYQKKCGFSDDTVFTAEVQEIMVRRLLKDLGLQKLKKRIVSIEYVHTKLRSRWASLGDISGKSNYGQRVGVSHNSIKAVLRRYIS